MCVGMGWDRTGDEDEPCRVSPSAAVLASVWMASPGASEAKRSMLFLESWLIDVGRDLLRGEGEASGGDPGGQEKLAVPCGKTLFGSLAGIPLRSSDPVSLGGESEHGATHRAQDHSARQLQRGDCLAPGQQ